MPPFRSLLAAAFLGAAVVTVNSQTTFNPVEDTTLYSASPLNNAGGDLTLRAGVLGADGLEGLGWSLLKFDLSMIPPGSTINSATAMTWH